MPGEVCFEDHNSKCLIIYRSSTFISGGVPFFKKKVNHFPLLFTYKLWKNEGEFLQGLADPLLVERLGAADCLLSGPYDLMPSRFCFERNFRLVYPSRENWADGCVDCNADMVWWTDGARNSNGVGSGAYEQYTGVAISTRVADHVTVVQPETYAMTSVPEKCNEDEILGKTVKIFTDSKRLMQSLEWPAKWILWRCVIVLTRLVTIE